MLLAKLHAHGFNEDALETVHSYLKSRYQRIKIHNDFNFWREILLGVPQVSVLGPLLCNIYLNNLIYLAEKTDTCNFAGDTTFRAFDSSLHSLVKKLEHDANLAIEWPDSNYMNLSQVKCHLMISGHKFEAVWANIGETKTWESREQKLLDVVIENNSNFDKFVITLCK